MNEDIKRVAIELGISRLCHFTPSRNLAHIVSGHEGVLATKHLKDDERSIFNATDLQRYDRHEDHVCCSIEYPNAWYLDKAREKDRLFKDWIVLFISPEYLWDAEALFSVGNAAAGHGRDLMPGLDGFMALYDQHVVSSNGRSFLRSARHLANCPTNQQAEVLVRDRIRFEDILGVAVRSTDQAQTETARLRQLGFPETLLRWIIAPVLFDKYTLSGCITQGRRPPEVQWTQGVRDGND